ncbi:hypothetical protein L596_010944 [Steinernema carpocapsae]|uniref:RanBP2-type domain-containing protein n=1 Tax=Steinernema carpocapsae TaxID=34508 RepID=A0A4V6A725_STECR|nr:hypothetical protein L596_010944 [Steinernema carpocapsae]
MSDSRGWLKGAFGSLFSSSKRGNEDSNTSSQLENSKTESKSEEVQTDPDDEITQDFSYQRQMPISSSTPLNANSPERFTSERKTFGNTRILAEGERTTNKRKLENEVESDLFFGNGSDRHKKFKPKSSPQHDSSVFDLRQLPRYERIDDFNTSLSSKTREIFEKLSSMSSIMQVKTPANSYSLAEERQQAKASLRRSTIPVRRVPDALHFPKKSVTNSQGPYWRRNVEKNKPVKNIEANLEEQPESDFLVNEKEIQAPSSLRRVLTPFRSKVEAPVKSSDGVSRKFHANWDDIQEVDSAVVKQEDLKPVPLTNTNTMFPGFLQMDLSNLAFSFSNPILRGPQREEKGPSPPVQTVATSGQKKQQDESSDSEFDDKKEQPVQKKAPLVPAAPVIATPVSSKPKGWMCSDCYVNNDAEVVKCMCCGHIKENATAPKSSAASIFGTKAFQATSTAAASSSFQFGFGSKSSEPAEKPKSAEKTTVELPKIALVVSAPNVAEIPLTTSTPAAPKPAGWNCPDCFVSNETTAEKCACCGGFKDGGSGSAKTTLAPFGNSLYKPMTTTSSFQFGVPALIPTVSEPAKAFAAPASLTTAPKNTSSQPPALPIFGPTTTSFTSTFEFGSSTTTAQPPPPSGLFGSTTLPAAPLGLFGSVTPAPVSSVPVAQSAVTTSVTPAVPVASAVKGWNCPDCFVPNAASDSKCKCCGKVNGTKGSVPATSSPAFGSNIFKPNTDTNTPAFKFGFGSKATASVAPVPNVAASLAPATSAISSVTAPVPALGHSSSVPVFGVTPAAPSILPKPGEKHAPLVVVSEDSNGMGDSSMGSQDEPSKKRPLVTNFAGLKDISSTSQFAFGAGSSAQKPSGLFVASNNAPMSGLFGSITTQAATATSSTGALFGSAPSQPSLFGSSSINAFGSSAFNNGSNTTTTTATAGFNFASALSSVPVATASAAPFQFNASVPTSFNFGEAPADANSAANVIQFGAAAPAPNVFGAAAPAPGPAASRKIAMARRRRGGRY